MADAQPPRLRHQPQSSSSIPSVTSQQLLPVLPSPTDIPVARPYTAATMASARTSFTHVDLDAPSPVPPLPAGGEVPALSIAVSGDNLREASRELDLPQCSLTFLLVSGRRRTMSFEPETTIGRVKELVWNAWPSGTSPSSSFAPFNSLPVFLPGSRLFLSSHPAHRMARRTSPFPVLPAYSLSRQDPSRRRYTRK